LEQAKRAFGGIYVVGCPQELTGARIDAILSRPDVVAERGRWVEKRKLDAMEAAWLSAREGARCMAENAEVNTPILLAALDEAAATVKQARAERDAAKARADHKHSEMMTQAELAVDWMCEAKDAARARDELGIQLAAQSERLRLAMAVVDAARDVSSVWIDGYVGPAAMAYVREALAALDAVPGDVLADRK
jgi:hypothetical protein